MLDAKRHQRGLIVTLMDLKNAFGEIDHGLIRTALSYHHHLPAVFTNIFDNIYSGASISASVNNTWTPHLSVNRGVLQGDPWSPMLFNLCVNTLMRTLEKENLKHLGYIHGPASSQRNCSWLQFADDAVVVSSNTKDSQLLVNIFNAWCNWSKMSININKCCTFGMIKKSGEYIQIEPGQYVNSEKIPAVQMGGNFTYLGKIFDFDLKNIPAKNQISSKLQSLLDITSGLQIKPQLKLKILKLYVHSQMNFELKLYNFGSTWLTQNLDALQTNCIRSWLDLPISSCVQEMAILSKHQCGLGVQSFKNIADKLWLHKRNSMKNSSHLAIKQIWSESSEKFIRTDSQLIEPNSSIGSASRKLVSSQIQQAEDHLFGLEIQGVAAKTVKENIPAPNILFWTTALESFPSFLFQFARKAILQQLPTAANLNRWKRTSNPFCDLCTGAKPQTNKHVLSNCSNPSMLECYTIRHNEVLKSLASWIEENKSPAQKLFVDIDGMEPINNVFQDTVRPDLVMTSLREDVLALELTVCHETNLLKSKMYKMSKYNNISNCLLARWRGTLVKLYI